MKVAFDQSLAQFTKSGVIVYTQNLIDSISTEQLAENVVLSMNSFVSDGRMNRKFKGLYYHKLWKPYQLPMQVRKSTADIFHETCAWYVAAYDIPVVCTVNDIHVFQHPEHFAARWCKRAAKAVLSLQRCDRIIAISEYVKRAFLKEFSWYDADKISVVYDGVDDIFRMPDLIGVERIKSKYNLHEPYILAVSTVAPNKNYERLLKAFSEIHKDIPQKLVFCGDKGWMHDRLEVIATNAGVNNSIEYLGYVPTDDLPYLYRGADFFAYPSLYEGFGLPILEAMASGTPVLTSNVTSMPEVAGNAAHLVDPLSVEDIAEGLLALGNDDAYRTKLSLQGVSRSEQFSWAKCARETVRVYHEVLNEC